MLDWLRNMSEEFDAARTYSAFNWRQTQDGLDLIDCLAPERGTKVLDLGCGTGNITKALAERVHPGHVTGIDPDAKRIDIAKGEFAADNIEYSLGSADGIPGGDYDLIFCNYVLHWVRNNEAAFASVARKLKPGGRFAFITLDVITQKVIEQHMGWASQKLKQMFVGGLKGLSKGDVKWLARQNNFQVEDLRTGAYALEFDDVDDCVASYMIHVSVLKESDFDKEKIRKSYGPGKICISLPTTVAILRKK